MQTLPGSQNHAREAIITENQRALALGTRAWVVVDAQKVDRGGRVVVFLTEGDNGALSNPVPLLLKHLF